LRNIYCEEVDIWLVKEIIQKYYKMFLLFDYLKV